VTKTKAAEPSPTTALPAITATAATAATQEVVQTVQATVLTPAAVGAITVASVPQLNGPTAVVEAHTELVGSASTLVWSIEGQEKWSSRVPGRVTLISANRNFVAAFCENGHLCVYTAAGGRLAIPPIHLDAPASFVACDAERRLLCALSDGTVLMWYISMKLSVALIIIQGYFSTL